MTYFGALGPLKKFCLLLLYHYMYVGGISHSSHLSSPGSVLVLGMGDLGQLGLGEDVMERKFASPVNGISNIVQVTCGGVHTVALDNRGQVRLLHYNIP